MNRIKYYLCTIVCIVLSLSSCIKEDLADCPLPVQLVFSYTGSETVSQEELKSASVYVFDENKQLLTSWTIDNPVFDKIYSPDKELVPGKHHFVVWFNLFAPYSYTPVVENQYILGEMLFNLDVPVPPIVEHSMTRLPVSLYGYREESIALNGNTVVIPVVQNSNKINVNVYGLTPTQDEYRFSIQDNNGTYTCYNVFATCGTFEYVEWVTFPQMSPNKQNVSSAVSEETSLLSASFNVLKLAADRPNPELIISNNSTGEQLFPREGYTNNLIQMILAADAKNDFDKTHVYNIDITFGGNPDITIKVNGWNASESNVEIVP